MRAEPAMQFRGAGALGAPYRREIDNDRLIVEHTPLVRKIAWHVYSRQSRSSELEDLIQIGLLALVEAARVYEERGYAFATYASTRIRGAMIDHLRKDSVKGRAGIIAARRIEDARRKLMQSLHRAPTSSEIADALGIAADEFFQLEQQAVLAITARPDDIDDSDAILADLDQPGADSLVDRADQSRALAIAIGQCSEREQLVLQLYFFEEMNLNEIAQILNISPARVCQIKSAAMKRIRDLYPATD